MWQLTSLAEAKHVLSSAKERFTAVGLTPQRGNACTVLAETSIKPVFGFTFALQAVTSADATGANGPSAAMQIDMKYAVESIHQAAALDVAPPALACAWRSPPGTASLCRPQGLQPSFRPLSGDPVMCPPCGDSVRAVPASTTPPGRNRIGNTCYSCGYARPA